MSVNRQSCAGLACIIFLLAVTPSVHCAPSHSVPSARFLLGQWKADAQSVSSQITSYQLHGTAIVQVNYPKGAPTISQTHWTAQNDTVTNRFLWSIEDENTRMTAAYDGHHWYSVSGGPLDAYPAQYNIEDTNSVNGLPVTDSLENGHGSMLEFNILTFIQCPWGIKTPLPLYDYIPKNASSLVVSVEEHAGQHNYHLHIKYIKPSPKGLALPTDIWFKKESGRVLPSMLQFTLPGAGVIITRQILSGKLIGTAWVPVEYTETQGGINAAGKAVTFSVGHYTLNLTNVGDPVASFVPEKPKNSYVYVNDR